MNRTVTSDASPALADEIERTTTRFLDGKNFPSALRSWRGGGDELRALSRQVGEIGLGGLLVVEDCGGTGAGLPEFVAMMRAVGRHLLPLPLVDTTAALAALAGQVDVEAWLDGSALLASGVGLGDLHFDGTSLSGRLSPIDGAAAADAIAVRAIGADGSPVFAVVAASDVAVKPLRSQDVAFAPAEALIESVRPIFIATEAAAVNSIATHTVVSRIAAAAHLASSAEQILRLAVEYAKGREQFGHAIGSFQAIKHLAADARTWTYSMDSMVRDVASGPIGQVGTARKARSTKAFCSRAAIDVAQNTLQIFGGIGYTAEHELALYYPRILTMADTWGSPRALEREIGTELLEGNCA